MTQDLTPTRKASQMSETSETAKAPRQGRKAFYVDETMATPNGYIPAIVFEEEAGFYPMVGNGPGSQPWYWGEDITVAKRLAEEANADLGLSKDEASAIVMSSIAASLAEDSAKASGEQRWDRIKKGLPADPAASFWDRTR